MIHLESWYLEAEGLTLQKLRSLPSEKLMRMLERTERRSPQQTREEWWAEQDMIYQLLVDRGVFEQDPTPVTEDVQQRRIKWNEWYRKKTEEDPEWHQRYLERTKRNKENLTPDQRRDRSKQEIKRQKERYQEDPSYAQKKRDQAKRRYQEHKRRMQEDPEYAEEYRRKHREKERERAQKKREKRTSKVAGEMLTLYHVTPSDNVPSISKNGLVPQIGPRSRSLGESKLITYFFPDRDAAEQAVMNWLGEEFEEDEPLTLLEVLVEPQGVVKADPNLYELEVGVIIDPRNIRVLEEL